MEMHQLRYLVAVAQTGNFSRAAEQCHVSQPSLSQQIQKLEEELGGRLFDRTKRQARLTPQGEALMRRAVRVLEEVDAARREAQEASDLIRGKITIGILPTIAPFLLPAAMAEFTKKFPGVEIEVQEDTTAHLLKLLHGCEIDFALASQPLPAGNWEVRELFVEDLWLALPRGHALARKKIVRSEDLKCERLIVMKEGHCLGDQVLNFCARRDVRPKISFRSAQLDTIQSLVSAGLGLSLVPAMAMTPGRRGAPEYRAFSAPRPTREIIAVWTRQRPPGRAANEFLDLVARRLGKGGGSQLLDTEA
jgi:LysR family hydrogen peroxide-inducible transcriptional activator